MACNEASLVLHAFKDDSMTYPNGILNMTNRSNFQLESAVRCNTHTADSSPAAVGCTT